ncbi:phosphoribosyltransferase [Pedobacter jamesrossensis]|uniref:Phosphoribosyltransferase n=1 Tax=Pedobacter jamesrossensis TaxID=1908238 RepID=A0ABV8NQM1_9SPHI
MKTPVKPQVIMALTTLFQKKKWDLSSGSETDMTLFRKFCERLSLFSEDEQDMLIELTSDFIRIGLQDYLAHFFESFILLGDSFFDNKDKIYVLPLVSPYSGTKSSEGKILRGKSKSADFLHYLLDSSDWTWFSKKLVMNYTFKKLLKDFDSSNSSIVLIDDFVGSGRTAADVCKIFLMENFSFGKLEPDSLKIVSLAAQKHGIHHVRKEVNVEVISNIIIPKGISDRYILPDLSSKIAQMNSVEEKLEISEELHFGYEKSEAMITFLNKTPNNTFPIYWHETKTKVAPFPRYKKFNL